jgi:hypothetical protein
MNKTQMVSLVTAITERVCGEDNKYPGGSRGGCGPVELRIGFVNNIVQHDGIVITDAPAAITDVVSDWIAKQKAEDIHSLVKASAGFGGLFVR